MPAAAAENASRQPPGPKQHRRGGATSLPSVCGRTNKQRDINFLQPVWRSAVTFMAGSERRAAIRLLGFITLGIMALAGEVYTFLSRWAPSHLSILLRRDCCSGR